MLTTTYFVVNHNENMYLTRLGYPIYEPILRQPSARFTIGAQKAFLWIRPVKVASSDSYGSRNSRSLGSLF